MSRESFGAICDNWVRENPDYEASWSFGIDNEHFYLNMAPLYGGKKKIVTSKADIPNGPRLNKFLVLFVLELLKAQLVLYKQYGIKV